jgi:hypothetical protein
MLERPSFHQASRVKHPPAMIIPLLRLPQRILHPYSGSLLTSHLQSDKLTHIT